MGGEETGVSCRIRRRCCCLVWRTKVEEEEEDHRHRPPHPLYGDDGDGGMRTMDDGNDHVHVQNDHANARAHHGERGDARASHDDHDDVSARVRVRVRGNDPEMVDFHRSVGVPRLRLLPLIHGDGWSSFAACWRGGGAPPPVVRRRMMGRGREREHDGTCS